MSPPIPLIIADGDIPTTRLIARELGTVFPYVEVRVPDTLFGTEFSGRSIVLSRLCHPSLSWLPEYLESRGLRYAYFLDDNFWEITPDVDVHLAPFYGNPIVRATLECYIRKASIVIVASERMRQNIAVRFPTANVALAPVGIDLAQLESMRPMQQAAHDGVFRIGYPTSRRPAVAKLLAEVVVRLGAKYPDRVHFEFVGWMPDALEGIPNVTLTPHIGEYEQYLEFVLSRQWDIGLAPLIGGSFESFKTDLKYREYAGFHVPGVYSRVSPYVDTVDDGRTGILVDNDPDSWCGAVERLIESPQTRRSIADAALADVKSHRDMGVTGARFAALLLMSTGDVDVP